MPIKEEEEEFKHVILSNTLSSLLICFTTEAGSQSIGIAGPLLLIKYIIDLLLNINSISAPNLFAGDTGVIIQAEILKISVHC
jgi:hypothetical protein